MWRTLVMASDDGTFCDLVESSQDDGLAAWLRLRTHYEAASALRVETLKERIKNTKMMASEQPREFVLKLVNMVKKHNAWAEESEKFDDDAMRKLLLKALPDVYETYREQCLTIMLRDPPSFEEMQLVLQSIYEAKVSSGKIAPSKVLADAMTNHDTPVCTFCHRSGHVESNCHEKAKIVNENKRRALGAADNAGGGAGGGRGSGRARRGGRNGGGGRFPKCKHCGKNNHAENRCFKILDDVLAGKRVQVDSVVIEARHDSQSSSVAFDHANHQSQSHDTASRVGGPINPGPAAANQYSDGVKGDDHSELVEKHVADATDALTAKSVTSNDDEIVLTLDSGAGGHMVNDLSLLVDRRRLPRPIIAEAALGDVKKAEFIGTLVTTVLNARGERILMAIENVLCVPGLRRNLISVGQLEQEGYDVPDFSAKIMRLPSGDRAAIRLGESRQYELLVMRPSVDESVAAYAIDASPLSGLDYVDDEPNENNPGSDHSESELADHARRHRRFGHLGFIKDCDVCAVTKARRSHLGRRDKIDRTDVPMGIVYEDLLGPRPMSIDGKRFGYLAVDEATGFLYGEALAGKDDCASALENLGQRIGAPKILRSDNEIVLNSARRQLWCTQHGTIRQNRTAYRPAQMGMIERAVGVVTQVVRSMLEESGLTPDYWSYAFAHAINVLNHHQRAGNEKTPAQKMGDLLGPGRVHPEMIRTFGCKAHRVLTPPERGDKVERVAEIGIHLGIAPAKKAYIVQDVRTKRIVESIDVTFHEHVPGGLVLMRPSTQQRCVEQSASSVSSSDSPQSSESVEPPETSSVSAPTARRSARLAARRQPPNASDDAEVALDHLSGTQSDAVLEALFDAADDDDDRTEQFDDDSDTEPIAVDSVMTIAEYDEMQVLSANLSKHGARRGKKFKRPSGGDPISLKQALSGPHAAEWQVGIDQEMTALDEFQTWSPCRLPAGRKAIPTKFVFKAKRNSNNEIVRWKARCVAMGNNMVHGVDYDLSYSSTAQAVNIRALLAAAVQQKNVRMSIFDVKNAYLNSEVDEEIYLSFPPGQRHRFPSDCDALRLRKGLYGIKQAGRLWQKTVTAFFNEIGLVSTAYDPCIFKINPDLTKVHASIRTRFGDELREKFANVIVYVDDLVFLFDDADLQQAFLDLIGERFKVHAADTDELLGVRVAQHADRIELSQASKIRDVIATAQLGDKQPMSNPCVPGWLERGEHEVDAEGVIAEKYRELVGKLHYIAEWTRPDIRLALMQVSRFCEHPKRAHTDALERIIRYLAGSIDKKLVYRRHTIDGEQSTNIVLSGLGKSRDYDKSPSARTARLHAFSDSDFAGDQVTRRSTSGSCIFISGNLVAWRAKMQSLVTLSSTAAEYVALASCAIEIEFLQSFLAAILPPRFVCSSEPPLIRSDNLSTIKWTESEAVNKRNKHVDVKYHFLKERVFDKQLRITHVATLDNVADIMTKP
ncbi:MAG: reverse transcriptase domain-containing protein, partial [Pseudomonadota bacterium]|nr:reverse transcriptase domain-containing protein [Pseudomonadota bacterium]